MGGSTSAVAREARFFVEMALFIDCPLHFDQQFPSKVKVMTITCAVLAILGAKDKTRVLVNLFKISSKPKVPNQVKTLF